MISINRIDKENVKTNSEAITSVRNTITSFSQNYPEIEKWYDSKVISGISKGNRYILLAKRDNQLAGFSILKKEADEKKICTFFVFPEYRGHQVAECLFEKSFLELNTAKPLISIPENRLNNFQKYIKKYNFTLGNSAYHYIGDSKEYVFNGILR